MIKLIAIVPSFLLLAVVASGHTCLNIAGLPEQEFQSFIDKTNSIFYGEVVGLERAEGLEQIVHVKLLRSWKGAQDPKLSISYQGVYGPFEKEVGTVGIRKTFYASTYDDGSLSVTFCGFQGVELDDRMRTNLGEGVEIMGPLEESFWSALWRVLSSLFSS